jgi:hypothetical protein
MGLTILALPIPGLSIQMLDLVEGASALLGILLLLGLCVLFIAIFRSVLFERKSEQGNKR